MTTKLYLSKNTASKIDKYFMLWALVLPISSVVLFPNIKGTTPAYLCALFAFLIVLMFSRIKAKLYYRDIFIFISIFVLLNAVSQLGLIISPAISFVNLRMVDPHDNTIIFRNTMFTQSLYLLASISTLFFVKAFYNENWDKYIFTGIIFLALYGIYEVTYFLLFKHNGDFLSNRLFGNGESGSLFQTLTLGPFVVQRLKSLTGEPSMYAFTVLPFWVYAIHKKKTLVHLLLLLTLLLTTSTTAILGIFIYIFARILIFGFRDKYNRIFLVGVLMVIIVSRGIFSSFVKQIIIDKLMLNNYSGMDRFDSFLTSMRFFLNASLLNQLFGLGFGYIRSTDMFSTLLVNDGIIGFTLFTGFYLYPIYRLKNSYREMGIKLALIIVYITMMISVSEFSYLSIWLFLGIAYNQITSRKRFHYEDLY